MADKMMIYKYVVKNVARKHGRRRRSCPSRSFGDNGSGMHTHTSLWREGSLFRGNEYARLVRWRSTTSADCSSTPGAVRDLQSHDQLATRLVPGYEAPVNLAYSAAQPIGGDLPHPDLQRESEGQADRVSAAGSVRNPYLRLRRC